MVVAVRVVPSGAMLVGLLEVPFALALEALVPGDGAHTVSDVVVVVVVVVVVDVAVVVVVDVVLLLDDVLVAVESEVGVEDDEDADVVMALDTELLALEQLVHTVSDLPEHPPLLYSPAPQVAQVEHP